MEKQLVLLKQRRKERVEQRKQQRGFSYQFFEKQKHKRDYQGPLYAPHPDLKHEQCKTNRSL